MIVKRSVTRSRHFFFSTLIHFVINLLYFFLLFYLISNRTFPIMIPDTFVDDSRHFPFIWYQKSSLSRRDFNVKFDGSIITGDCNASISTWTKLLRTGDEHVERSRSDNRMVWWDHSIILSRRYLHHHRRSDAWLKYCPMFTVLTPIIEYFFSFSILRYINKSFHHHHQSSRV